MAKSPATEAEDLVAQIRRLTLEFMNLRRTFGTVVSDRSGNPAYWQEAQLLALDLLGLASAFQEQVADGLKAAENNAG